MVDLGTLVAYTDDLLEVVQFNDYCPNGLQVEGKGGVRRLISGVTASQALLDAAIEARADAILVHHGYFWRGEDARVVGMKQRRLKALLAADVSLLGYHLPLDAHPAYGNNAQLAELLGLSVAGRFGQGPGPAIGMHGSTSSPVSVSDFSAQLQRRLGRAALHIPGRSEQIRTLAWCTGAAQGYIEEAAALGVDAYLTGEVSEQTVHIARECGVHFFAAGHHATERYGVQALGEHLSQQFDLEHQFIDIDNPV